MTTAYFDTSALVRLVLHEPGTDVAAALWDRAPIVATSRTSDLELRAVLAAGERRGLVDAARHADAASAWQRLWRGLYVVELAPVIAESAAGLVERHALRGGDAVHLASALALAPDVIFVAWDEHAAAAAQSEGLTVLPGQYGYRDANRVGGSHRRPAHVS